VAKKRRAARGARGIVARAVLAVLAFGFGSAAYAFLTLPNVRGLRTQNPSTTAFEEIRAREAAARGEPVRRVQRWVPYSKISSSLKRAVLVAEDSAFWQHDGIDLAQIKDAVETNIERREFVRGASTITQQLAKNLYLSPSKNPMRKLRELLIARRLEAELSKQRILELYLNVIEWGDGIYGAEAAAREYFHTSASQLGPEHSALLAAAIITPRLLDPARPTTRLRRRQQMILRRMGAVTPPPVTSVERVPGPEAEPEPEPVPSLLPPAPPDAVPGELLPAGELPDTAR
jgi:monofunctional biosynthetic peptidoglycan transglycosylase